MTKELEVTIRISNNRLKERRAKLGYSQHEMALVIGIPYQTYGCYEHMSKSPLTKDGQWSQSALKVAEYFDCDIEELFPPSVLKIVSPRVTKKFDGAELHLLMSSHSQGAADSYEQRLLNSNSEDVYIAHKAVARLRPIEAEALRSRFGMDGEEEVSYREQGKRRGFTGRKMSLIGQRAILKVTRDIYKSRHGRDRFEFCYLDSFAADSVHRLGERLREELGKRFPGIECKSIMKFWLPTPIEVRAYGFRQAGIAEIQSQVDTIAQSVFESEEWKMREKRSEPVSGPKKRDREVVEFVFSSGHFKKAQARNFVAKVVESAVSPGEPKIVRAICESRADGQLIADGLLDSARHDFGVHMSHKSVIDWSVQRTILELSNGSAIDLLCKEIAAYKLNRQIALESVVSKKST